uniref:Uncharacterized protein n=1 Tax=Rhizophora mucronata TaxID=61149 RepID=A0A2P2NET9_RHIMU
MPLQNICTSFALDFFGHFSFSLHLEAQYFLILHLLCCRPMRT